MLYVYGIGRPGYSERGVKVICFIALYYVIETAQNESKVVQTWIFDHVGKLI